MMKILLLLSFFNLFFTSLQCETANLPFGKGSNLFPWDKMRLPKHIVPIHYDLFIHPNLTTLTFSGVTKIEITVIQQTSSVILHSVNLNITKTTIQEKLRNSNKEKELKVLEHPPFEQIALFSTELLQVGHNYIISIEYSANFSDSFHGFYKSTYRTPEGKIRLLAVTQFEATYARRAFPCFDEPAFKATFSVKIRREPKHVALSNMPLMKSLTIKEWLIEDSFEVSVKMSTYLVAFMVSDFKSVTKMTNRGIKVSVYTVPDKINQADYALNAAVKLLDFYEGYFSIPYPLPKHDLVGLPDFQSAAMENWGLTTYRESVLLYDPKSSSIASKLGITMTIAHELAHQWFGNLVTMEWWNDLWLNEGFAKFMEYVSVNITHPDLKVEDHFLNKYYHAMKVDGLNSSHPICTPVENPSQILEMFDGVSYDKGACILNMLMHFLGSDMFKAGLVKYLLRFSYGNTQSTDLWDSLTAICLAGGTDGSQVQNNGVCARNGETISRTHWTRREFYDVKTMMDTWTLQQGFPLVTVTVKGKNVHLQQELYRKDSNVAPPTGNLWHIPLTYITSKSDVVQSFFMSTNTGDFSLPEEVEWIKFNAGMHGYYIVHYGEDGWDALIYLLKNNHNAISSNDRTSLITSVFQLESAGKLSITKALDLTSYLKHESEIVPVSQGLGELIPVHKLMEKRDMTDTAQQLKRYILCLFQNIIDQQSWTDEGSVSERLLRSTLLLFACVYKYQPCVDKATEYFMTWKASNGTLQLPNDVKTAIYVVGARTDEGWDFIYSKYQLPEFYTEREEFEYVLSMSHNQDKLQWLMDQGLQDDIVKIQNLPHIIVFVGRNPVGGDLAWLFLKEHWKNLVQKFELGSHTISAIVNSVTNKYSTEAQLAKVKEFFSSQGKKTSQLRCVQQAIETIEENIQWMGKNLEELKKWLEMNSSFCV